MIINNYFRPILKTFILKDVSWFLKPIQNNVRDVRRSILKKEVNRYKFKEYFEDKLPTINQTTQDLIKEIGTFKTDVAKLEKMIDTALDTHFSTEKDL